MEFGADYLEWHTEFPCKAKFEEMTSNGEVVRPIQITYKNFEDRGRLTAIEMLFSNEIETPLYEDDGYKQDDFMWKFIDIDPNRQIRSISVRSDPCGWIFGLRLMDEDGVNIVDENWNKVEDGDWVTKDITKGEEIIGL